MISTDQIVSKWQKLGGRGGKRSVGIQSATSVATGSCPGIQVACIGTVDGPHQRRCYTVRDLRRAACNNYM